ncbi:HAD-IB family phosphatase [Opitutus sp. GAS368]|uniref:HAD-IB family phosphatase n=1 Tax=Opitutus sp. GAS368 TaxID=1882749 RepID=UPI000B85AF20|nr:HAD-IB family phosphatase [Opitutus sp. GAS368]
MTKSPKLVIFDCDSTLSAIEGIDELARVRGPQVFAAVEAMTTAAMEGKIAVEDVFARRLAIIRPRRADVAAVGRLYVERVEPTALATIVELKAAGWTPLILSGGFRPIIAPLAAHLGIARVEAVDLFFDAAGNYTGYDDKFPTTRSGGKPELITGLKRELTPARVVMVGDGVSDLETKPVVDLFVGFGRYTPRAKVKAGAHAFINSLAELPALLQG